MILAFLASLLVFLEVALVFYPLVIALIFLSILCLPSDLNPYPSKRSSRPNGKPVLSMFFNVVMFAAVLYHFNINVGFWKNWLPLLGGYLVLGVVWATLKWWIFCGKVRDSLKELVDKFNLTVDDDDNVDDVARSFMAYLFNDTRLYRYKSAPYVSDNTKPWPRKDVIDVFIPLVTEHKSVVLAWLFCWPMSLLKMVRIDILYNGMFSAIKGGFQNIAAKRFKDI